MPNLRNIFNDPLLRDVSVAYRNAKTDFVADRVFPSVLVDRPRGDYFVYDKTNLRRHAAKRTGKAEANEIDFSMTKTPYGPLQERSLKSFIPKDEIRFADDPYDPRNDHTEIVTESLMVDKEAELVEVVTSTSNITNNVTLSGTDQWDDYTNSTPFDDIRTAVDSVHKNGFGANTLVLPYQVFSVLAEHPDLLERVKYNSLGVLTAEMMAKLFKVDNIIVAQARYNSANEGATDVLDYIWGNDVLVARVNPAPALRVPSLGYHLQLEEALEVDNWEREDGKGEYVQVTDYYEPKLVAGDAGYLIKAAI